MLEQELKAKLRKKAGEIFGDRSKLLDPVLEEHTTLRTRDIGVILQAGAKI